MKNTPHKLKEALVVLGLSRKEAAVYISLLELGLSTVSQISRKAAINRATGYVILDSLITKGLVSISGKEPKQEYVAESPDNLAALFEAEQKEAKEKEVKARELSLQLKSIQKVGDRPQVRFYEGTDGIKAVFEDSLTAKSGSIIAYTSIEDQHVSIPNYFPEYYQRRKRNKIFMRSIFPDTPMGRARQDANENEYRESVLVPAITYGIHSAINVYDNKLMIASFREKLGIIVESEEIADAMKKIFELAWIGAHSLDRSSAEYEKPAPENMKSN
ncbi:MAG: transcriptional regulator TrmB [Parcubacteria group bacterium]|nr:transcriptional regulator TrmB [Parcubacteria group bacterium]